MAIYAAIGSHRVRLEGEDGVAALMTFCGGGNPEQDAQNFLQGLRERVQAGAETAGSEGTD